MDPPFRKYSHTVQRKASSTVHNKHEYRRMVCDVQVEFDFKRSKDTHGSAAIQVPTKEKD